MGAEIRGVELSENSLNSLLIDDLFSHYILTMRRSYCGILRVNCVINTLIIVCKIAASIPSSAITYQQLAFAFQVKPKG